MVCVSVCWTHPLAQKVAKLTEVPSGEVGSGVGWAQETIKITWGLDQCRKGVILGEHLLAHCSVKYGEYPAWALQKQTRD